jgi:hypothetical protein
VPELRRAPLLLRRQHRVADLRDVLRVHVQVQGTQLPTKEAALIDEEQMDKLAEEAIASDTPEYLAEQDIDFEAAGHACGQLARSTVEFLGYEDVSDRAEERTFTTREIGGAVTTALLCAFELGVRAAKEAGCGTCGSSA